MEYQAKNPVALIMFNRPDITRLVFEAIRKVRPEELFVIADGPRSKEEKILTDGCRAVIDEVDWDCKVHKNYSDKNLGGKWRPYTGMSWVFKNVNQAIFLEDDNLPNASFFRYCDELLERFRDDSRIFSISGANFHKPKTPDKYSYWFSTLHGLWGWATWKRSWEKVDIEMKKWGELRETDWLKTKIPDKQIREMYKSKFDRVYYDTYKGKVGVSYAYLFAMMLDNAMDTRPEKNLISNIGFRADANNTTKAEEFANFPREELSWPLRHPPEMKNWVKRDIEVYRKMDPNVNYLKYTLKQIPVAGKILVWGKKILKKLSRVLSRATKSLRISSTYRFSLTDYFIYIFEELAHKKIEVEELADENDYSHLQIRDFKFYWPKNQARKELTAIWQEIFNTPSLNPHAYEVEKIVVSPDDVVIDAGAGEGFFTHLALLKRAKTFAFEPVNIMKTGLEKTFKDKVSSGQLKVVRALLGDRNEQAEVAVNQEMLSMSKQGKAEKSESVEMVTLDKWVEKNNIPKIDFIKMDIEGAEVDAIKGAYEIIKKNKPKLAIAIYHDYENANRIKKILQSIHPDYRVSFRGIFDYDDVTPRPYMLFAH